MLAPSDHDVEPLRRSWPCAGRSGGLLEGRAARLRNAAAMDGKAALMLSVLERADSARAAAAARQKELLSRFAQMRQEEAAAARKVRTASKPEAEPPRAKSKHGRGVVAKLRDAAAWNAELMLTSVRKGPSSAWLDAAHQSERHVLPVIERVKHQEKVCLVKRKKVVEEVVTIEQPVEVEKVVVVWMPPERVEREVPRLVYQKKTRVPVDRVVEKPQIMTVRRPVEVEREVEVERRVEVPVEVVDWIDVHVEKVVPRIVEVIKEVVVEELEVVEVPKPVRRVFEVEIRVPPRVVERRVEVAVPRVVVVEVHVPKDYETVKQVERVFQVREVAHPSLSESP